LEVAQNGVVDGEVAVEHFLEVLADVSEAQVQALQGLQLRGYAGGEGADGDVADVAEKVLDADFFGFFGFDLGGGVYEGFGGCGAILRGGWLAVIVGASGMLGVCCAECSIAGVFLIEGKGEGWGKANLHP